jgi:hypothetical protein
VETPERNGLLESHRYRLQKHIKKDFLARNGRAKTVLKCGSGDGQVSVSCQCCNEHSGSIKAGNFFTI